MNLTRIQNALTQNEELPVQTWRFSPAEDGEDLVLWDDIQNMRYRQDGYRQDLFFRGGSTIHLPPADLAGVVETDSFVDNSETITQVQAFSVSIDGDTTKLIFVKTNSGKVAVWNPVARETLINSVIGGFSGFHEIDLHTAGRFLYLFDGTNKTYRYIDLKKKQIYTWANTNPPAIEQPTGGEGGIQVTEGEIEKNVFGFKKGATVIACPQAIISTSVSLTTEVLSPGVYKYVHNAGKYITINSEDVKTNRILTITSTTSFSLNGSGTDPDLFKTTVPIINGQADMAPLYAKIDSIQNVVSAHINPKAFYITLKSESKLSSIASPLAFLIIPGSPDLETYLETSGGLRSNGKEFESVDEYETPTLHRSYVAVYELDDGSFTLPGSPVDINIPAYDLFFNNEAVFNYYGIRLKNTAHASPPANAVKLHLFATRWQVNTENCYRADERYPNGTYYRAGEYEPDTEFLEDFTPDSELLTPLSSLIPMSAGIYNIFARAELQPRHITSFKNGALYSNYTVKRDDPSRYVSSVDTGTPLDANDEIIVQPEYTDNQRGTAITFDTHTGLRFHGVNALVTAFHIYWVDDSASKTYYVGRVSAPDPEFYGMLYEVDISTTYPEEAVPTVTASDTEITFSSGTVPAFPPQMINISEQKILTAADKIEDARIIGFDADRGIAVRYRVIFLTNAHPVSGILTSGQGEQTGNLQLDVEPMDKALPLLSKDSVYEINNGLVFQSTSGIWYTNGSKSTKIIDIDKYPELQNKIEGVTYNPRWNELWFLCNNNDVLTLSMGSDSSPPVQGGAGGGRISTSGASVSLVPVTRHSFPSGRPMRSITTYNEKLYSGAGGYIITIDNEEETKDNGFTAEPQNIIGTLISLPVTPFDTQLKIWDVELYGHQIEANIAIDTEEQRFDDYAGASVSLVPTPNEFTEQFTSTYYQIEQRGTVIQVHERGISPRLKIQTKNKGKGRLIAVQLRGRILKNQHAPRK